MSDHDDPAGFVSRLAASVRREPGLAYMVRQSGEDTPPPSRESVRELVELLRRLVFVGYFDELSVRDADLEGYLATPLARAKAHLEDQIAKALRYVDRIDAKRRNTPHDCNAEARNASACLLEALPEIRRLLALDVQAAFDGDPAATHTDETILCYPGLDAIFAHRIAHELYRAGVPMLPRMIAEQAHSRTGIDIHPGAAIGESFFIDHGTGVVIGETTVIGDRVKIYQGVTLGAKSFPRDEAGAFDKRVKRHPTIGSRVTIYAHAVILGGDTIVGDDCVISGTVLLTQSVPAGHIVRAKAPELVYRENRGQA
jgi:serine O-acetyltransferase